MASGSWRLNRLPRQQQVRHGRPASASSWQASRPIGGPPMRSRWAADLAPPILGGIAEAAWIGVFAAAAGAPPSVAGPAASRGVAQGDPDAGDATLSGLVRASPFLIGTAWIVGLALAADARNEFVAEAFN